MSDVAEKRWVFFVRTDDHPGVAGAVAMVFSGRGIQIESFVGYGDRAYAEGRSEGRVVVTFSAFTQRMQMVRRVLNRLEAVRSVAAFDYEWDKRLIKTAVARVRPSAAAAQELLRDGGVDLGMIEHQHDEHELVISGHPPRVDEAVRVLGGAGSLVSSVYCILPPETGKEPSAPGAG